MESVSFRRGLCRHIPYICFYITSYFRLAVPLLHEQPVKISCGKHWYSYLKAAHLEDKAPAALCGKQPLPQAQAQPLVLRTLVAPCRCWVCCPSPMGTPGAQGPAAPAATCPSAGVGLGRHSPPAAALRGISMTQLVISRLSSYIFKYGILGVYDKIKQHLLEN